VSDPVANPYKGLAAFEDSELDVLFFFGRDRERERITANLIGSRLTVLYGETGVGKSSILRAGVAHQLRGFDEPLAVVMFDDWRDEPATGLARAAAQAAGTEAIGSLADTLERCSATLDGDLYLILDEVEEYFLYHPTENGERGFGAQLAQAVRRPGLRARFLLSLREDAVIKLDRFKRLIPNLFGNYLRLEHLDREAARAAILGPLERYNELAGSDGRVEIEPELVEAVLNEVTAGHVELGKAGQGAIGHREGTGRVATPYLQLVMHRLWEEETGAGSSVLRLSTFRALGGAESIVRNHLQRALMTLGPAEQDLAAEAFDHLVTPSGAKVAHTASDLARYASVDESELLPVLQALVAERILRPTADETGTARYEIYHDVLADAVTAWRAQHESARELERVQQAAARKHRRLLVFAMAALVLAGAMAAVTIFALTQRSQAEADARRAEARSWEDSALSQLQTDPEHSLKLAARAAQREPDALAVDVLRRALIASRERAIFKADGPVTSVGQSPDGSRVLVAGGNRAFVYELHGRTPLLTLEQGARIIAADYSPTGRLILTAGKDGRVLVWPTQPGRHPRALAVDKTVRSAMFDNSGSLLAAAGDHELKVWRLPTLSLAFQETFSWSVSGAVFSPDDQLIAAFGNQPSVFLFDLHGTIKQTLHQRDTVTNVAFSPDGKWLFAAGQNGSSLIWDTRTGKLSHSLRANGKVLASAFSRDGNRLLLATAGSDTDIRLWDAHSGRLLSTLTGHTHFVVDLAFRPDGLYLATASKDNTARVWRTDTSQFQTLLAGHSDTVTEVTYVHRGRRAGLILTGSADSTARLWDPQNKPHMNVLKRRLGRLLGASYIDSGSRILTAGPGREALLLRASDGHVLHSFRVRNNVKAVAASHDGNLVAVGEDKRVVVFDAASGKPLFQLQQRSVVKAVAFSPTSDTTLVTGGQDAVARIWRLHQKQPQRLRGHRGPITAVAFSPDGRRIATASDDTTARIWDAHSGLRLFTLNRHTDAVTSVAWDPKNGRLLLTASKDGDAMLWDAETGRRRQLLRWHLGPISNANFSPDGQWIITTGPTLLQLWQPGTHGHLFPLGIVGTKNMTTTTFDPSSRRLLTANRQGMLLTYACQICRKLGYLLPLAQRRLADTTP
jgi:WD40 repeat protein